MYEPKRDEINGELRYYIMSKLMIYERHLVL